MLVPLLFAVTFTSDTSVPNTRTHTRRFPMSAERCAQWFRSLARETVLALVAKDLRALEFASATRRNDREIVLAAVTKTGRALEFASETLRNDREIVLAAVTEDGLALDFASDTRDRKSVV